MRPADAAAEDTRAALEQAGLFRPFAFIRSRRQRREAAVGDAAGLTGTPPFVERVTWRLWRRTSGRLDRSGAATTGFAVLAPMLLMPCLVAIDTFSLPRAPISAGMPVDTRMNTGMEADARAAVGLAE
jgi:hypothetical protein